jgi:hypothetical protein
MIEAEWSSAVGAEELWAFVRSETRFNRYTLESNEENWDDYNRRLLYLLGVAVCRRLEPLFPDPCCQRMLEVAEAFAEGRTTLDELADAHDAVDALPTSHLPAASNAAAAAVFWLSPDDYKVIRMLWHTPDATGYLHAIAAGVLPAQATHEEAKAIWQHPAFLAGREAEERAVCDLIREVIGNPFRPLPSRTFPVHVTGLAGSCYDGFPEVSCQYLILADALEELGESDAANHCRQPVHAKGCYVLDWILCKS